MIYVIDYQNRLAFADQIEEMYRIRHRIYVEKRGWRALAKPDCREIDQFDTEDAIYLLGIDHRGHVTSGVRLVPTNKPHLLADVFSHLVERGDIPRGDRIYEMTRYFLTSPPKDEVKQRQVSGELLCAMFELGIARKWTHFTVVCDSFFLPTILECGHKIDLLGLPQRYDEGECIAILSECSEEVLLSTAIARGVTGPTLVYSLVPPPKAMDQDAFVVTNALGYAGPRKIVRRMARKEAEDFPSPPTAKDKKRSEPPRRALRSRQFENIN